MGHPNTQVVFGLSEERVKFALVFFVLSRGALFMPKRVPDGGLRPIITIYGGTVKGRAPEDRYFLEFITYLINYKFLM